MCVVMGLYEVGKGYIGFGISGASGAGICKWSIEGSQKEVWRAPKTLDCQTLITSFVSPEAFSIEWMKQHGDTSGP